MSFSKICLEGVQDHYDQAFRERCLEMQKAGTRLGQTQGSHVHACHKRESARKIKGA